MKIRNLLTCAALILGSIGQAQTPAPAPTRDFGLSAARETIDQADAQFDARQAEVLDAVPVPAIEEELEAEAAPEALPVLPDTIDPAAVNVEDVYMDFGDEDPSTLVSRTNDTMSIDYPDESVRTIIRNVADLYELNVIIPESLVGMVSLTLRDVTWRQVFDVVLEQVNYTWVEDGNIIKIKSLDELLAEPVTTRVFVINFATAGELLVSVAPLIDGAAGGRIQVDARSNALVITERPSRLNDVQAIIERLDRPTDQVMIESKFVEVTQRDEKNLGINWAALNGYELAAGPFSRNYTNQDSLDRARTRSTTTGSDFDLNDGVRFVETDLLDDVVGLTNNESRLDTAVFNADAFSVILSALENNNEVELVSNPTVVTMNNTAASINIGEEFPIPAYNYNEERGSFEVSGFDYKPIGILLNVTPQVNSAGFINLAIAPEISSRTGEVNFGGAGGASIPIITTRKTESVVTIKSGFTLAIGGLLEQQTGITENKVPVLGDVPILGRLFRSNSDSVDARNLIIFITAKVLNPDGSTYEEVFSKRTLNEMGISPRDVPGFEPPPAEDALYQRLREEREKLESLRNQTELRQQLSLIDRLRTDAVAAEAKRYEKELKESTGE